VVNRHKLLKLGLRIRELRLLKGISQENLADLACLHRTYIGSIERGERNVSFINIVRLAEALEVSLSDLMKGVD
jgi:transcriptional regulator with XRE-family HTH domain